MAEKDDKNKAGDDKDDKNKTLTTEEIQAIAKKAEAALAAEDDDDDGDDKNKKTGDDEDGDDDDLELDPKNIDTEKTLKYIDKLKDENAKRRIANKKLDKKLAKQTQALDEATKALKAATERLTDVDNKTAEQIAQEKSDLEKAQKTIDDLSTKVADLEKESEERAIELAKTNRKVMVQDRSVMVERLVKEKEVGFASDFEREGLISKLTAMDGGEFVMDNDEVIYDVMKFIKDKKANVDKSTPGPGPANRKTSTPIGDEIQALLKSKNLSPEQKKRLDELLDMSGKA